LIPLWFLGVYVVAAGSDPVYRQTVQAVSYLGAEGRPGAAAWNFLGFIVPGLVIASVGWLLSREFLHRRTGALAGTALASSGLLLATAGIFPTDTAGVTTLSGTIHWVSGWGSFASFLAAAAFTPWLLWRHIRSKLALLSHLLLAPGPLIYEVIRPNQWWVGQRIGLAAYFFWVAVTSLILKRVTNTRVPDDESVAPSVIGAAPSRL
jgi:hypothetical membrane protein